MGRPSVVKCADTSARTVAWRKTSNVASMLWMKFASLNIDSRSSARLYHHVFGVKSTGKGVGPVRGTGVVCVAGSTSKSRLSSWNVRICISTPSGKTFASCNITARTASCCVSTEISKVRVRHFWTMRGQSGSLMPILTHRPVPTSAGGGTNVVPLRRASGAYLSARVFSLTASVIKSLSACREGAAY
jgi:hypothetical protein